MNFVDFTMLEIRLRNAPLFRVGIAIMHTPNPKSVASELGGSHDASKLDSDRRMLYRSGHRTILTSDRSRNPPNTIADASAIASCVRATTTSIALAGRSTI